MNPNLIDDSDLLVRRYAGLRMGAAKETALHRAADKHEPKMGVAVQLAFAKTRSELKKLLRASKVSSYTSALEILKQTLQDVMPARLAAVMVAGAEVGASMLRTAEEFRATKETTKRVGPFAITFDTSSEQVIDWADKHAAELIDGITETTREHINNAVAEYLETGDWDTFTEELLEVVSDDRAKLIAHTEVMTAVHEGQREAWRQAEEEGLLTGRERVVWIVTGDDKVCPICQSLDGQTRPLDGQYESDEGEEYDGPPAHPRCRCTEGIV